VTEYLGKTMEHLLIQTIGLENLEIILVDDASTDDGATRAMLLEYEKQYPDNLIIIPLDENMRQGGARNIGLLYASGEYIAYCDAEDWFVPQALERLYDIAKKYDCDVVEFDNRDVKDYNVTNEITRSSEKEDEYWEINGEEERKENILNKRSTLGCWNKLYRASMLKDNRIRYAEHVVFEEPAFTYMVRFYEKKHYFVHEILHYCLIHEGSTMHSNYEKQKYDNLVTHEVLLRDLMGRGFMEIYREEVEYIFWYWYFYSTFMFAAGRNTFFTREEFMQIQKTTAEQVPDIKSNRYFQRDFAAIPQIADLTYCDVSHTDMSELYQIFRTMMTTIYSS
jgi:glycosyltransferase involved in cell wall biosynthesis